MGLCVTPRKVTGGIPSLFTPRSHSCFALLLLCVSNLMSAHACKTTHARPLESRSHTEMEPEGNCAGRSHHIHVLNLHREHIHRLCELPEFAFREKMREKAVSTKDRTQCRKQRLGV